MKKLRLNLDSLHVDSFQTASPVSGHGTVRPHENTEPQEPESIVATCECPGNTGNCGTANATCYWSCGADCSNATCGNDTCWGTCANTCNICGPQDPVF
jgi:hypothetical protein